MTWSDFYLFCFIVGFSLSVLSFLGGAAHIHLPSRLHLHFHGGHHARGMAGRGTGHARSGLSWFNAMTIMTFLAWFGGLGYILSTHSQLVAFVALFIAVVAGLFAAGLVFKFMARIVKVSGAQMLDWDYRIEGTVGTISSPEGHLRGIIGQLTVEQIVKEPEMVGDRMRSTCAADMNKMGLDVVSFTLKEVRDKNEYITNMGRPDIARIKRDAEVAAAEADRDIAIKRAESQRAAAVAKTQADQERVAAETASLAKQAEAERDLDLKKASYLETTKKAQATADKAYEIETNVMQQQVVAESVKVQQVEREAQVKVQDAEIERRERELIATVLKQAEVERQRIETLASAERQRLITEAEGRASAIRAQGEAEAEIIFKKGEAEAKAMNVKAEAFQEYNQAAVLDKLISGLPEVVRALAEPLGKVDKVTIVSTGNGDAAGAYKLTGDITKIAAQVPALFEALSGMQVSELLSKVRLIGDKAPKPEQATPGKS